MERSAPPLQEPQAGLAQLIALLAANAALAMGPWLVRLADTGPVAAGFWRLGLALPVLMLLSMREGAPVWRLGRTTLIAAVVAGLFFAFDLVAWHLGIVRTRLGNAALFGNSGSVILMAVGLFMARRRPRVLELLAIFCALAGAALLMGGSLELSQRHFAGDLFCLLAGALYAGYLLALRPARSRLGGYSLLAATGLVGTPILLGSALILGERVVPTDWTPVIALAISSQLIGQGLLIYSLRFFSPLVLGLALLTQPAIAASIGWLAFGEMLGLSDILGMALIGGALLVARLRAPVETR